MSWPWVAYLTRNTLALRFGIDRANNKSGFGRVKNLRITPSPLIGALGDYVSLVNQIRNRDYSHANR